MRAAGGGQWLLNPVEVFCELSRATESLGWVHTWRGKLRVGQFAGRGWAIPIPCTLCRSAFTCSVWQVGLHKRIPLRDKFCQRGEKKN